MPEVPAPDVYCGFDRKLRKSRYDFGSCVVRRSESQHGLLSLLPETPLFIWRRLLAGDLLNDGGIDFAFLHIYRDALEAVLLAKQFGLLLPKKGSLGFGHLLEEHLRQL